MAPDKAETMPLDDTDGKGDPSPLPTPVSHSQPWTKPKLSAATIIPIWMSLSAGVIMYNKYVFTTLKFAYPSFLVTWHLVFAVIGTRILRRTTHLLDGVDNVHMTREKYIRSILPIGIFMSGSLILSNTAYLHLSVAFIQMLKAFVPVAILIISFAFRIQEPNRRLAAVVLMISSGVSLASYGEINFNMFGFLVQAAAVMFEASRLVMIEILLHGQKMDPLVSLYYFAPVCAALNFVILVIREGYEPLEHIRLVGAPILLSNALVAFGLNVAAVFLVGVGSGLVLTLAGVLKDILMITGSVLIFGDMISPIQIFGYGIALAGLVIFRVMGNKK